MADPTCTFAGKNALHTSHDERNGVVRGPLQHRRRHMSALQFDSRVIVGRQRFLPYMRVDEAQEAVTCETLA